MKLIVGLGNIGKEYVNTRHNIGFIMLDNYLPTASWGHKFNGLCVEKHINNEKVIFLKPCLYMNLSGEVIKKYVDFYKIDINDILIIHDDLDLNLGTYRLRASGSSGGHNGLKNIELNLGTKDYKRLKIGISNNKEINTVDYVLGNFNNDEKEVLSSISSTVNNIIDDFINMNFSEVMNKYNHK